MEQGGKAKGKIYSLSCLCFRQAKIAPLIDTVYLYDLHLKNAADADVEEEMNGKKEQELKVEEEAGRGPVNLGHVLCIGRILPLSLCLFLLYFSLCSLTLVTGE